MRRSARVTALPLLALGALSACAGVDEPQSPPAAPSLSVAFGLKTLRFNWSSVPGAERYRLLEDPTGSGSYAALEDNLSSTSASRDVAVHRIDWAHAQYLVEACNASGCTRSSAVDVRGQAVNAIGYLKASGTEARAAFGAAVAVSGDGRTLAVGAAGTGRVVGAVYVFLRESGGWRLQARLQGGATESGDYLGAALALSSDGDTLVAGAPYENGAARTINGDQQRNTRADAGAAYVFVRSGGSWSQQAYLKAANADAHDSFGMSVAASADGNTVAVGAPYEDGSARGINGDATTNRATDSGAAYVFVRRDRGWSQEAYVKARNREPNDWFGYALALSASGDTLVVGAPGEDGGAGGIGGDEGSDSDLKAGAAYLFTRGGTTWSEPSYVKASVPDARNWFGAAVAISGDGRTFAVGAPREDGGSGGIDGDQANNDRPLSGAVYVFAQRGSGWQQAAYAKASNPDANDTFGSALALSASGDALVVGAPGEAGSASALGGNGLDNGAAGAGAAYVFGRSAETWSQRAYVKSSNSDTGDAFGSSVALASDGNTLLVGAPGEASNATGIGGNQGDNSRDAAGAAYLY